MSRLSTRERKNFLIGWKDFYGSVPRQLEDQILALGTDPGPIRQAHVKETQKSTPVLNKKRPYTCFCGLGFDTFRERKEHLRGCVTIAEATGTGEITAVAISGGMRGREFSNVVTHS